MKDINTVTLVGRLTADQQINYTNSGLPIGNFSLAVNDSVKQNNQWQERVNYFDITVIGKMSESLNPYLKKGKQIAVSGRLRQDRWQVENGSNRQRVKIVVDSLQLISSNRDNQGNQGQSSYNQNQGGYNQKQGGYNQKQGGYNQKPTPPPYNPDDFDDDIPF